MMMPVDYQDSALSTAVVIEAIGLLIDDRGELERTIASVVAAAGVELRPGALSQVRGASIEWAIATLLEGHGRSDLVDGLPGMVMDVQSEWRRLFDSGRAAISEAARECWVRLAERPVLLLFGGDPALVAGAIRSAGLPSVGRLAIGGGGARGIPHPDQLRSWIGALPEGSSPPGAAVRAGAAALAVASAGCSPVVLVGPPAANDSVLPVDGRVGTLAEWLAWK